jgi:hypothetical protein
MAQYNSAAVRAKVRQFASLRTLTGGRFWRSALWVIFAAWGVSPVRAKTLVNVRKLGISISCEKIELVDIRRDIGLHASSPTLSKRRPVVSVNKRLLNAVDDQ